jgi:hypothetical protein
VLGVSAKCDGHVKVKGVSAKFNVSSKIWDRSFRACCFASHQIRKLHPCRHQLFSRGGFETRRFDQRKKLVCERTQPCLSIFHDGVRHATACDRRHQDRVQKRLASGFSSGTPRSLDRCSARVNYSDLDSSSCFVKAAIYRRQAYRAPSTRSKRRCAAEVLRPMPET